LSGIHIVTVLHFRVVFREAELAANGCGLEGKGAAADAESAVGKTAPPFHSPRLRIRFWPLRSPYVLLSNS
jgi:hypothetical protein